MAIYQLINCYGTIHQKKYLKSNIIFCSTKTVLGRHVQSVKLGLGINHNRPNWIG